MPLPPERGPDAAARVLLIERDDAAAATLVADLTACFAVPPRIETAADGEEAVPLLRSSGYDLVLADLGSLGGPATPIEDALARLVRPAEGALLIMVSDAASVSAAVAAMRAGAHDYITRPVCAPDFAARIGELAHRHGKSQALAMVRGSGSTAGRRLRLIGTSSQMQAADERVPRTTASPASVFVAGERGTSEDIRAPEASAAADLGAQPAAAVSMPRAPAPVLPMWQQEQRIIEEAIACCNGSIALAAAALELSPSTIYRKRQAWAGAKGAA